MAREDLIPFNQRTEEEQKSIARAGGKASGQARRIKAEKKKLRSHHILTTPKEISIPKQSEAETE